MDTCVHPSWALRDCVTSKKQNNQLTLLGLISFIAMMCRQAYCWVLNFMVLKCIMRLPQGLHQRLKRLVLKQVKLSLEISKWPQPLNITFYLWQLHNFESVHIGVLHIRCHKDLLLIIWTQLLASCAWTFLKLPFNEMECEVTFNYLPWINWMYSH